MFEFSTDEIIEALSGANNLNAAIKKILKHEVRKGSPEERFFKDFRHVVSMPKATEALKPFIERHLPDSKRYGMVVAGYLHDNAMAEISSKIIDEYAEDFNTSYETLDSKINIKDREKFEKIAKDAMKMIGQGLSDRGLPASSFMTGVVAHRLFTPEVLEELGKIK